jgi:putative zinc finger/helix-turn-helix YgiT family protein
MINMTCDECKSGKLRKAIVPYHTTFRDVEGDVKNLVVDNVVVYRCDECGNELLDDAAMQQIEDARRHALGLLSATEICELRERLRRTQKQMSELLGIGEKTYCRWESGSFQSEAFDRYLRLIATDSRIVRLLERIAVEKAHPHTEEEAVRSPFIHLPVNRVVLLREYGHRFSLELLSGELFARP